jgi:hypothetical protein
MELQPLSPKDRDIRLFRFNGEVRGGLYPPAGDLSLSLQLEHRHHNEAQYVALSYVWGNADDLSPIIINGIRVLITLNLHNALTCLWQRGLKS